MLSGTVTRVVAEGTRIGLEIDTVGVVWGDERIVRKALDAEGVRVGSRVEYDLEEWGELAWIRLAEEHSPSVLATLTS